MNVTGTRDNYRLELDEAALEKILMKEKIRDKPVAVISINGKSRQGKSFLLNMLLHDLLKKANAGKLLSTITTSVTKVSRKRCFLALI